MSKKAPLTAIQFNALAIVTLLAFMPFAIAFITSAGSNTDGNYESSINGSTDTFGKGYWYDNGANYTSYYETTYPMPQGWYNCAYISQGYCGDDYSYSTDTQVFFSLTSSTNLYDVTSYTVKQNQQYSLSPGEYLGTSGPGPYGWLVFGDTFTGIEQNTSLDSIKYNFIDIYSEYVCDYDGFTDLRIEASLTFLYENESQKYDGFDMVVSNKYEYNRYDPGNEHWDDVCVNGIVLEFDFTGFESLAIDDFNNGDWESTDHLIQIKNIEREDNFNIGNTLLPFNGDGLFVFSAEHQEIDPVQAGFIIKSLTTVLSVGTFALALASTQYWNPVSKRVKGGF